MTPETQPTIPDEAMALAEEAAAKDRALLADIKLMAKHTKRVADEKPKQPERNPMNRAERRAQVKVYAAVLAMSERQTPVINPTIVPRAQRRRQKQHRRAS